MLLTAPRPFLAGTSLSSSVRVVAPDPADRLLPGDQEVEIDVRLPHWGLLRLGMIREGPQGRLDVDAHRGRQPRLLEDAAADLEYRGAAAAAAADVETGLLRARLEAGV